MAELSPEQKRNSSSASKAPSRLGKKGVTFYLEPDAMKQLRSIGLEEEKTLQALMLEATNLLFKSRGQKGIAK